MFVCGVVWEVISCYSKQDLQTLWQVTALGLLCHILMRLVNYGLQILFIQSVLNTHCVSFIKWCLLIVGNDVKFILFKY